MNAAERAITTTIMLANGCTPVPPMAIPRDELPTLVAIAILGGTRLRRVPFTCRRCGRLQMVCDTPRLRRPLEGTCGACAWIMGQGGTA